MERKAYVAALALALLVVAAAPLAAQTNVSGSLQGTIMDADGGVLPGVTVSLTSDALVTGRAATVTDERGAYRFPSLPPGMYTLQAELAGFKTARREQVRISLGQALSADVTMEIAAVADEIVVTAESPVVSVVANTVSTNLDEDFLQRQPLTRGFNALMNYAPGVNDMQAYGGTDRVQNSYTLDGVNVANPASGDYWILPSVDWLEEVQVGGLGANAEYGGFTGGVFNAVTKSGGNTFRGDVSAYYYDDSFISNNTDQDTKPEYANTDFSLSLGGPVMRDAIWFFVSANAVEDKSTPIGAVDSADRHIRRYLGKLTWQANDANRIVVLADYDGQDTDRRGIDAFTLPDATWKQESPNYTYNVSWESLVNSSNFLALKLTGFDGKDDRLAYHGRNTPGHYDSTSGLSVVNAEQTRYQHYQRQTLDASWSLFADGLFGKDSHSFKFGGMYEATDSKEDYYRNGGFTYYDRSRYCSGASYDERVANYLQDPSCGLYSADFGDEIHLDSEHTGWAIYAQDSMKLSRVTINYGVRYGAFQGGFGGGRDDVYDVDYLDPRIGFTWDVLGDARTAIKAHYGRYHSGMFSYLYDREQSGNTFTPYYYCDWNPDSGQFDDYCSEPTLDSARMGDINHPYVDQWVATFEQQLGRNMAIGVDYIHKEFSDIVAMVNVNDDYDPQVAPDNPLTGGSLPFYDLLSPTDYVLTNPQDAYRDYDSVVLRFDKRYSDGWMVRASLLWADLTGNSVAADGYVGEFEDLNGQTNAEGTLSNFSKYEFKLNASVDLPFDFQLSGYYVFRSGEYWTPYVQVRGLYYNDRQSVNLVPRGSEQLPDRNLVDLRLAWNHTLGGVELGIFLDAFNVLNSDTVLSVSQRWGTYYYDYEDHPGNSEWVETSSFQEALDIEEPRTLRVGFRLSF